MRRQVKPCKCKPGRQVPRPGSGSGSGSAGCTARHKHGSTVAQPATEGKSLSSNVASQQRSGEATASRSGLNRGCAAVLYRHSTSAQVVEPQEGKLYSGS